MKTVIAAAMIVAAGIIAVFLWHPGHSGDTGFSSSQIFVHDTPVCVVRHGGEIVAAVGFCDAFGEPSRKDPTVLPPGHPPVDAFPGSEPTGKIPI